MISNEIKKYIYDNLTTKDFTNSTTIKELEEVLKSNKKFSEYFNSFNIREYNSKILSDNSLACYEGLDNSIHLYMERIYDYYLFLISEEIFKDDMLSKNIFMLSNLIHEFVHIYQRMLYNEKDYNISSFVVNSRMFCDLNSISYFKNSIIYRLYYDIFPVELHAEGENIKFISSLLDYFEIYKKYSDFLLYSIVPLVDSYKYRNSKVIPPMKRYYKLINKLNEYNSLDFAIYSELERFLFGMSDNLDEINDIVNKLIKNKDFSLLRYKKLIRGKHGK